MKLPLSKYSEIAVKIFKNIGSEIIVLFILLLSINNYLKEPESRIGSADGKGYYDYLPSIFIRHDINRKDFSKEENLELYSYVNNPVNGFYAEYEDKFVNKAASGTALLQLPFFLFEYWTTSYDRDSLTGYEPPFEKAVFHATLFYLFLGLFFMKLFMVELKVKIWIIFFIQLLLTLGTNLTFYVNFDASFSHVYSFFAFNVFLYVAYRFFHTGRLKFFVLACLFLGLILNIRQINILIILILPFLAGSWDNLKQKIVLVFSNPKKLIIGLTILFSIVFVQFYFWYLQTGHWVLYSYQNESFDFSNPHFIDILFSYKKGLFLYTPITFLAVLSSFVLLVNKKYYLFGTWFMFFVIVTYVFSSWWSWYFGCSFGLRAYIEYYGIMFIPFALLLNQLKNYVSFSILAISLVVIPLNLIQTYQYQKYILHWIDMNESKYWSVFLETHEKFEGLVWADKVDFDELDIVGVKELGTVHLTENSEATVFNYDLIDLPFDFKEVTYMLIKADAILEKEMDTRVSLFINDMGKNEYYYHHDPYLVKFSHEVFGIKQLVYYKYAIERMDKITNDQIEVKFFNSSQTVTLENVEIVFCK